MYADFLVLFSEPGFLGIGIIVKVKGEAEAYLLSILNQ